MTTQQKLERIHKKGYTMANLLSNANITTDFQAEQHNAALRKPIRGFERALVTMLEGWAEYAEAHKQRYSDTDEPALIGNDGVLGPEWEAIGSALKGLLDGESGRLDGATVWAFIHDTLDENGGTPPK